jgi:PAS domain S-box-containing protein
MASSGHTGTADRGNRDPSRLSRELAMCRAELEQARSYLQGILQNTTDMIFAADVDGILFSFSQGGERVLGFTMGEVAGKEVRQLAVRHEQLEEALAQARDRGSVTLMDVPFRARGGREVFCNVSLVSMRNRLGQHVGTIGICQDITQWKRIQEQLRGIERLAEMGRLAAGIAHEINNPLAIIQEIVGWSRRILAEEKLESQTMAELDRALGDILEQTRRGRAITHELLGFVREAPPMLQEVDLGEVVERAVGFLRHEMREASVLLEMDLPHGRLRARSDPRMLEQLLVNLLTNALDAIQEKGAGEGRIRVALSRLETGWEIRVSDNGTGIAPEHQAHVFDLLYTTKGPGKGTGLGLPICQRIVASLGGEILFESAWGEGTTFVVRLPEDPKE